MIERIRTDCLYPSFDQVEVVCFPFGDKIRVSDEGGAARSVWMHGGIADAETIRDAAIHYGAEIDGQAIYADAASQEWKRSAVLAVANASAEAARDGLARHHAGLPAITRKPRAT